MKSQETEDQHKEHNTHDNIGREYPEDARKQGKIEK